MKVEALKIFYRMVLPKEENTIEELRTFLQVKGLDKPELTEEPQQRFKNKDVTLDVEISEERIVLLFGTRMHSDEFLSYVDEHFQ